MLEVELNTLDPKSFDNIQVFFTKFKYLLLSLGECGICNTLFPPFCKNNYIGQELWQTQRCECLI
jgi:hypothetical protein